MSEKGSNVVAPQLLDPQCPSVMTASLRFVARLEKRDVRLALASFSKSHAPTCQRCQLYGEHLKAKTR